MADDTDQVDSPELVQEEAIDIVLLRLYEPDQVVVLLPSAYLHKRCEGLENDETLLDNGE